MARIVNFQGRQLSFPDNASDDDISQALGASAPAPKASTYVQPAPPPGEVIHGTDKSYISDQPAINATRPPNVDEKTFTDALKLRGKTQDSGPSRDMTGMYTQGASFNLADEAASGLNSLVGLIMGQDPVETYNRTQEVQRQQMARTREEHPIGSTVAEVGGGLHSGLGLASNGFTAVGRMANEGIRNILPRALVGGMEGAGYAGVSGFGGADGGLEERANQAVKNLPVGAALGAAAVPAVDLLGVILRPVANAIRAARDPAGRGDELIAQRLLADNQSPETIAQAVEAARNAGQPEYRAVDAAGRNTQRIGAMAAKTPGSARTQIADDLAARQQGQGDRIAGYVDDALGAGDQAYANEQTAIAARRANAAPIYEQSYRAPPPQGQFYDEMLARQSVQDAMRGAERTAAENQVPITDLFAEVPNPNPQTRQVPTGIVDASGNPITRAEAVDPTVRVPTMRGWDYIKRELDARVNQLFASGDTTLATATKETRNALREQLGNDNADYRRALQQYSDDSSVLDGMQAGRDVVRARNPDEANAAYAAIDPANRATANAAASREIGVTLDNMRAGQDKTLPFTTPNMQGKLDTLVEDPVVRALLGDRIGREQDMVRAGRALTGGSSTYENLADGGQVSDATSILGALMSGNPLRAIGVAGGRAMGALSRGAAGMNELVAQRVADYLMSADPQQIRSLADMFTRVQADATAPTIAPAVVNAGANAPRTGQGRR